MDVYDFLGLLVVLFLGVFAIGCFALAIRALWIGFSFVWGMA